MTHFIVLLVLAWLVRHIYHHENKFAFVLSLLIVFTIMGVPGITTVVVMFVWSYTLPRIWGIHQPYITVLDVEQRTQPIHYLTVPIELVWTDVEIMEESHG